MYEMRSGTSSSIYRPLSAQHNDNNNHLEYSRFIDLTNTNGNFLSMALPQQTNNQLQIEPFNNFHHQNVGYHAIETELIENQESSMLPQHFQNEMDQSNYCIKSKDYTNKQIEVEIEDKDDGSSLKVGVWRKRKIFFPDDENSRHSKKSTHKSRRRTWHSFQDRENYRIKVNAQERQRTQCYNEAFVSLRKSIPTLQSEKLSRVQTLKLATHYIDFLSQILSTSTPETPKPDNSVIENVCSCTEHEKLSRAFSVWRMKNVGTRM